MLFEYSSADEANPSSEIGRHFHENCEGHEELSHRSSRPSGRIASSPLMLTRILSLCTSYQGRQ